MDEEDKETRSWPITTHYNLIGESSVCMNHKIETKHLQVSDFPWLSPFSGTDSNHENTRRDVQRSS
jgi:hypothetical protein